MELDDDGDPSPLSSEEEGGEQEPLASELVTAIATVLAKRPRAEVAEFVLKRQRMC